MDLRRQNRRVAGAPWLGQGRVVAPRREFAGPGGAAPLTEPQLIRFQPLVTLMGTASSSTCAEYDQAIQHFGAWFDGGGVSEVQFKVELFRLNNAVLYLESSPFIEEDPAQWVELTHWNTPPAGHAIFVDTAVSSSEEYGLPFSRYIRWRVAGSSDWEICFRIKALIGASFTQFREQPRVV